MNSSMMVPGHYGKSSCDWIIKHMSQHLFSIDYYNFLLENQYISHGPMNFIIHCQIKLFIQTRVLPKKCFPDIPYTQRTTLRMSLIFFLCCYDFILTFSNQLIYVCSFICLFCFPLNRTLGMSACNMYSVCHFLTVRLN